MSELKPGIYAMRDPKDVRYVRGVMRTGTNVVITHDDIADAYCRHLINTRQLLFVMDAPQADRKSVSAPKPAAVAPPPAPARAAEPEAPSSKKPK